MQLEKSNVPSELRPSINRRLRDYHSEINGYRRKLRDLAENTMALYREPYRDDPEVLSSDSSHDQRQTLLEGTDRLDRSSSRLKASQALALETETIGASTLADLYQQREVIDHTQHTLYKSEGAVDRSIKTLKTMGRRYRRPPIAYGQPDE